MVNTGHGISLLLELGINEMVNISGGPLAYNYPIFDVSLHYGLRDEKGSEHTIDGEYFAGRVVAYEPSYDVSPFNINGLTQAAVIGVKMYHISGSNVSEVANPPSGSSIYLTAVGTKSPVF